MAIISLNVFERYLKQICWTFVVWKKLGHPIFLDAFHRQCSISAKINRLNLFFVSVVYWVIYPPFLPPPTALLLLDGVMGCVHWELMW